MEIEIGDELVCVKQTTEGYPFDERLILGETYKVDDIDVHFPGKVAVKLKGPLYHHVEFVPTECFDKKSLLRDKRLKQLGI